MSDGSWLDVQPSPSSDLATIARTMFALMLRNVVTEGLVYEDPDPANAGKAALPGCVLASPSYPTNFASVAVTPPGDWTASGRQNYVHNWTRDAAVVALEMCAPGGPLAAEELTARMVEYVNFAAVCQSNAPRGSFDRGAWTIDGRARQPWSDQSDGPALQALAVHGYLDRLPQEARTTARSVVEADLAFLLSPKPGSGVPVYQDVTTSLWEEEMGHSFFARSVQLRCLQEIAALPFDIAVPAGLDGAIMWLSAQLAEHWSDEAGCYLTFAPPWEPDSSRAPYDPNIDIVLAALLGAGTPIEDPKLLATAWNLMSTWTEDESYRFSVNEANAQRGLGPLLGRYPGDTYDGDTSDAAAGVGHPWALSTCAVAELHYRLAGAIGPAGQAPEGPLAAPLLDYARQAAPDADLSTALRTVGDRMLQAVVFHSDNLELSEQFDRDSGFEKSVSNLTWSYAAFVSAVRARAIL